jgi:SAM-dependent methyltransferase
VRQNLYDDPEFFAGYTQMRDEARGLHENVIAPCLPECLPALDGKRVIDLGCGDGWFCRYAAAAGAKSVAGVDPSARMLQLARERSSDARIEYVRAFAEEAEFGTASADVVVSVLALHYVAELAPVLQRIARWLVAGGVFVEIVEHPIFTSQRLRSGWAIENGRRVAWPVSDYFAEGARTTTWFVDGVVRYHRSVSTILNQLGAAGLRVDLVAEPRPTEEALQRHPDCRDDLVRPSVLVVRAVKAGPDSR